jgi:nickel transport system substrate-binding protein
MARSSRRAAVLCALAALVLTGCGGGRTASQSSASLTGDADATVTFAMSRPAGNLDPHIYDGLWNVQNLVFEPLVQYGPEGEIVPSLAEEWETSPDGRTHTFTLREGATFSDGTPVDSAAAKWNLERWVGNPDNDFLGTSQRVTDITTPDPQTLQLTLSSAYPLLLQELTITRPVRLLSPKAVDSSGEYTQPIGSGPFVVQTNGPTETVLTRNDAYWGEKPKVAKLVLKVLPDAKARINALRTGEVDVTGGDYVAPLSPDDAATLESGSSGATLVRGQNTATLLLGYNTDAGRITADQTVREAVDAAIDRQALVNVYQGYADPAGSLFPATIPHSDGTPAPVRDLDGAKAKLEAAGWTGGPIRARNGTPLNLVLAVSEEAAPGSRALGEAIQAELREVGIDVEVQDLDHATRHDVIPKRQYDLALFYTIGAPYDPHNSLTDLFKSTVPSGPDGKIYLDEGFDPYVDRALAAVSEADRDAAYSDALTYLQERTALSPLLVQNRLWAYGQRVSRLELPPTEYDLPIAGLTVG